MGPPEEESRPREDGFHKINPGEEKISTDLSSQLDLDVIETLISLRLAVTLNAGPNWRGRRRAAEAIWSAICDHPLSEYTSALLVAVVDDLWRERAA